MAVRSLLHYALEVPDQTVGETFYRSVGLVDAAGRDGAVHRRPASRGPGFAHASFAVGRVEEIAIGAGHMPWEPRDFPEAEALYHWGPPVPDAFGVNREPEG